MGVAVILAGTGRGALVVTPGNGRGVGPGVGRGVGIRVLVVMVLVVLVLVGLSLGRGDWGARAAEACSAMNVGTVAIVTSALLEGQGTSSDGGLGIPRALFGGAHAFHAPLAGQVVDPRVMFPAPLILLVLVLVLVLFLVVPVGRHPDHDRRSYHLSPGKKPNPSQAPPS